LARRTALRLLILARNRHKELPVHTTFDPDIAALFLCIGCGLVLSVVLAVRTFAWLLLLILCIAAAAIVGIDGIVGAKRWLAYGVPKLVAWGPQLTALGIGKLLGDIVIAACWPASRRSR
jgi:hypothetical protein